MADDEPRPELREVRRGPEWFLEKIAAGLEAAGIPPAAPSPVRKMSRSDIDAIVTATLSEELARLPLPGPGANPEPRKPEE
jgi:hypothetical protein